MRNLLSRPRAVAGLAIDRIEEDCRLNEPESGDYHLKLVEPNGEGRLEVQHFIAEAYSRIFGANLREFYPFLIALCGPGNQLLGASGARYARGQKLFAEQYLGMPAEDAIAEQTGNRIDRQHLVEVGSFSVVRPALTYPFISMLGSWLQSYDVDWLLFVLTRSFRRLFERAGIDMLDLGAASAERLAPSTNDWGSYYWHEPRIMAVNLQTGLARFQAHRWSASRPVDSSAASRFIACPA